MPSRYVQMPNGSYLEWPENVSAAEFKAKASRFATPQLPVSTRGPSNMPLPVPSGPKPYLDRVMDYIGQGVESTAKLPNQLASRAKEIYQEGSKKGGFAGGLKMAESPILASGGALTGLLKSVMGVTTPGIAYRMSKHEDPAKIAADAGSFLGGYMVGGPKEATAGEGGSVSSA